MSKGKYKTVGQVIAGQDVITSYPGFNPLYTIEDMTENLINKKPEKQKTMKEEEKKKLGLLHKYNVEKADGTPVDEGFKSIVLRYDQPKHDAERRALLYYAKLIKEKGYEKFGNELSMEIYSYSDIGTYIDELKEIVDKFNKEGFGYLDLVQELEELVAEFIKLP